MMYFVLQTPSLQHLAGVNIVAHLWNGRDFFIQLDSHFFNPLTVEVSKNSPEWRMIKSIMERKIWVLPLPEQCKKEIMHFIGPLGTEILRWYKYYNDILLFPQLCWTMHGTIDYKRTAELMVKDERVDLQTRFELACIHCLEEEARQLFPRVAKVQKHKYVRIVKYVRKHDLSQLILFFTRSINLDVRHESMWLVEESFNTKFLFQAALPSGNRAVCEYMFKRLKPEEKVQVFEECRVIINRCSHSPTCNLIYYLSLMNEEQQRLLFPDCTIRLLECLLHWPMQSLFIGTAEREWHLLSNRHWCAVLIIIISKIRDGFNDYDYAQLFWECWRFTSADYKQFYLKDFWNLIGLLRSQREEFLQLILNEGALRRLLELCNRYYGFSRVLMDESVMSEAALMACKQTAALNHSNDDENEEKRLRSELVTRLVDSVMASRMERRGCPEEDDSSDIFRNLEQIFHRTSEEYRPKIN